MKKLLYIFFLLSSFSALGQTYRDSQLDSLVNKKVPASSTVQTTNKQLNPLLLNFIYNKVNWQDLPANASPFNGIDSIGTAVVNAGNIDYGAWYFHFVSGGTRSNYGPVSGSIPISLAATDQTRIDLMVGNSNGTITIITGTESNSAGVTPPYSVRTQLPLAQIFVYDNSITVNPPPGLTLATYQELVDGSSSTKVTSAQIVHDWVIAMINEALEGIMTGGGGGGHIIQSEYSDLPSQPNLNFIGNLVTAVDDAGNNASTVTVNAPANAGNIAFVSSSGNNSTAVVGDVLHPFLTIPSAITSVSSGGLIYVLPGTYGSSGTGIYMPNIKLFVSSGAVVNVSDLNCAGTVSISGTGTINGRVIMYGDVTNITTIQDVTINGKVVYSAYSISSSTNEILTLDRVTINGGANPALHLLIRYGGFYHRGIDANVNNCTFNSTSNNVIRLADAVDADDLGVDSPNSTLTIRNSRLIAVDLSKSAISAGAYFKYYLAYNAKNTGYTGSGTVTNEWAATMGDGFSVGTGGGGGTSIANGSATNQVAAWNGTVYAPRQLTNTDISGLGTLSTQSGTFSGTHSGASSGTNTGNETASSISALIKKQQFTATASQTVFTLSSTVTTTLIVVVAGVVADTSHYTASGTTLTLTTGAAVGEIVQIIYL